MTSGKGPFLYTDHGNNRTRVSNPRGTPAPTSQARHDSKTVLIADDDRDLVNVLSVRCRRMGLKVLAAHDSYTALSLVRARRPDVICLDVQMPSGSGLSVCEMLTSDEAFHGLPIVILTGRSDPDTICRCHSLCAYYVEKCPEIWTRIEPLLKELLNLDEEKSDAGQSPGATAANNDDNVRKGETPTSSPREKEPERIAAMTTADAENDRDRRIASDRPSIGPTSFTTALSEVTIAIKTEQASDSPEAAETPDATTSTDRTSTPAGDGVWNHLTQFVSRVVNRRDGMPADDPNSQESNPVKIQPLEPIHIPIIDDEFDLNTSAPGSSTKADAAQSAPDDSGTTNDTVTATAEVADLGESRTTDITGAESLSVKTLDKAWTSFGTKTTGTSADDKTEETPMKKITAPDAQKTVLIADDDVDLVQMLVLRCTQMGLRVFRSPDAMHALLGVHRVRPDLVILDVNMPGGNGLSVCEMLAGDKTLSQIPVILVTGDKNESIPKRAQLMQVQFLLKGSGLWERLEPLIRRSLGMPVILSSTTAATTKTKEDDTQNEGGRRPRILCIDDDPDISKILKFRLERYGVDVLRAFNGMQGYWTALDMQPELIILDMVMPDGAGNYILGRLRSHPLTEKTPVIMLTGVNTPGVRRQLFGLGIDAYLTKPLDFTALLEHIRQYVPLTEEKGSQTDTSQLVGHEHDPSTVDTRERGAVATMTL